MSHDAVGSVSFFFFSSFFFQLAGLYCVVIVDGVRRELVPYVKGEQTAFLGAWRARGRKGLPT
jgi:hypothetical protein